MRNEWNVNHERGRGKCDEDELSEFSVDGVSVCVEEGSTCRENEGSDGTFRSYACNSCMIANSFDQCFLTIIRKVYVMKYCIIF